MAILALDVGERRIGVAVSDPGGSFALPLRTIERTNLNSDLTTLAELAREYGASTVVVGDPVALDGTRGVAAVKMDQFCKAFARVFKGEIARVDERLTTAQVNKTLIAADVSRAKRKLVVDRMAAALILESYLARRKREAQA